MLSTGKRVKRKSDSSNQSKQARAPQTKQRKILNEGERKAEVATKASLIEAERIRLESSDEAKQARESQAKRLSISELFHHHRQSLDTFTDLQLRDRSMSTLEVEAFPSGISSIDDTDEQKDIPTAQAIFKKYEQESSKTKAAAISSQHHEELKVAQTDKKKIKKRKSRNPNARIEELCYWPEKSLWCWLRPLMADEKHNKMFQVAVKRHLLKNNPNLTGKNEFDIKTKDAWSFLCRKQYIVPKDQEVSFRILHSEKVGFNGNHIISADLAYDDLAREELHSNLKSLILTDEQKKCALLSYQAISKQKFERKIRKSPTTKGKATAVKQKVKSKIVTPVNPHPIKLQQTKKQEAKPPQANIQDRLLLLADIFLNPSVMEPKKSSLIASTSATPLVPFNVNPHNIGKENIEPNPRKTSHKKTVPAAFLRSPTSVRAVSMFKQPQTSLPRYAPLPIGHKPKRT